MRSFQNILDNGLSLKLHPISIRELLYLTETPTEIFGLQDGIYKIILKQYSYLSPQVLKDLIQQGHVRLFIDELKRKEFVETQQNNLRTVMRSLSIDDPFEKGKKALALLTINMGYLYQNPTHDPTLQLQYQTVKNLALFLYNHPEIHEKLYLEFLRQKHHYIFAQPLISSLFVMGVMKQVRMYSEKDVEALFMTSYFKDIGMSAIPVEKYDEARLSEHDKRILSRHPEHSVSILQGRIPLGPNHLRIIENHHSFSLLNKEFGNFDPKKDQPVIYGLETMIISVMDIIAAMIAERPYRAASTLFDSLELVKLLIADQYPQEFRIIVTYFKSFFQSIKNHTP